jgi:ubiquinone/menaquinone biosynthesis C-methylase UbiE
MQTTGNSSQLERVRREFSRAEAYALEYQGETPIAHYFNMRLRRVSELLKGRTTGRVLDLGCGPARAGALFRGTESAYCGVDVSEEMLGEARKEFGKDPQFCFCLASIENLPFRDGSFHVVMALGSLEYVADGASAAKEMARVAKPKGTVLVSMHNKICPYRLWQRFCWGKLENALGRMGRLIRGTAPAQEAERHARPVFTVYGEKRLSRLLGSADLKVEDVAYYDFNVFPPPLDRLFPKASVYVSRKLGFLSRSWLRHIATAFVIVAERL